MVKHGRAGGFTLIELLVVLAIVALLATIAVPRYFQSVATAKDTILRENLLVTRATIDKFYADTGRYPDSLNELVEKRYLRALPFDPWTRSTETWSLVPPEAGARGQVYSLRSGAPGTTTGGEAYADF